MRPPFEIQWLGTAAFKITYQDVVILLDPWVSRNPHAVPPCAITPEELAHGADLIFVSHGHFDHIADIPRILRSNRKVEVWGPPVAMKTLRRLCGDENARIHEVLEGVVERPGMRFQAQMSKHVRFDAQLISSSLRRILTSPLRNEYVSLNLITHYRCGETLSWVLNLGETRIRFLGSAGPTDEMLRQWANVKDDILLVPLQGNSKINEIGAHLVHLTRPAAVIPHHHDDFYPPISQSVDISLFRKLVSEVAEVRELNLGERYFFSTENGALRLLRNGLSHVDLTENLKDRITTR